ncbi:vWA domain-containing protein [Nocardia callitridis]|uniref:VWA domain-containing protein n=1 Tax=Nocardia callitridis TaxID=648753 RepID=A0ABP9K4J8_9NOCA
MSRLTKSLAAAGLTALVVTASPAHAQEREPGYAPTMVVLDASGSMNADDPSGGTKMDAAKTAVRDFVDAAPTTSKVGLTAYGTATGSSDAEKTAGCTDVRVLREVDTLDQGALTAAVDGIRASGYTPIGASLREAAAALPNSGPRSVVLVSDGVDTCAPPDPCAVAQELHEQGVDLVVHAIGFGVDAASRAQLTCIAQQTGGTYTDAADGPALKRVLPRVSQAALRTYQSTGTAITGTETYNGAPVATPGQYLDTLGQKRAQYYAVDVPQGATAYFGATVSFPRVQHDAPNGDTSALAVRVYDADGADCHGFESESVVNSSHGAALTISKTWDGATEAKSGDRKCRGGGRYYFSLEWSTVADNMPERTPVELLVGIEPAVTDPGPATATGDSPFTEPTGEPTAAVGGGSFNVAGTLPSSGSYTDTLQRGEFVFYRVRLDWGQGLAYRVRYEGTGSRGVDGISNATTTLYSPFRAEIDHSFTSYTGETTALPNNDPALTTAKVRYANRTADAHEDRSQSVPGWYYIAVKLGPAREESAGTPVPISIDVAVSGQPEPGPIYQSNTAGDVFGEKGTPSGTDSTASTVAATKGDEDSATGMIALAAGAAVLLVLVGGGAFAWRKRKAARR